MILFILLGWVLCGAYGWVILRRWWAWVRQPEVKPRGQMSAIAISVIIPVRNEAAHILKLLADLEAQTYSRLNFEVLVVDDHSEDNTTELVQNFKKSTTLNLHLIDLRQYVGQMQKKSGHHYRHANCYRRSSGTNRRRLPGSSKVAFNFGAAF